jgi:hypothetical protein
MRIVPAIEAELRREIRDARALDPLISVSALEQRLEKKFNRGFSYRYIAKLADKIARQALIEADRTQVEERLAFTRENYRIVRERLMKIITWEEGDEGRRPWNSDVTDAARMLVMLDLAVFKAEIDNASTRSRSRCSPEKSITSRCQRMCGWVIIAAWKRGGMLSAATVEEMVPEASQLTA